jgi:hypothetical protein
MSCRRVIGEQGGSYHVSSCSVMNIAGDGVDFIAQFYLSSLLRKFIVRERPERMPNVKLFLTPYRYKKSDEVQTFFEEHDAPGDYVASCFEGIFADTLRPGLIYLNERIQTGATHGWWSKERAASVSPIKQTLRVISVSTVVVRQPTLQLRRRTNPRLTTH